MSGPYLQIIGRLLIGALVSFGIASCGSDEQEHDSAPANCAEDTRDEEYAAGITKTGDNGYTFEIMDSDPAPPIKGDNSWTVVVRDSSDVGVGGTLDVEPFMPDHGHGTAVVPVVTPLRVGSGYFEVTPVNFFMPGYWETTVTLVDDDDNDLDTVVFKFCVDG